MVMAWNVLRIEVVLMDRPRVTLNTYKTALQPASSRKCLTPKDDTIYDIIANRIVNILTIIRCMKMGSIGLLERALTKKLYTYSTKSNEFPMTPRQSWDIKKPIKTVLLGSILSVMLVRLLVKTKWTEL